MKLLLLNTCGEEGVIALAAADLVVAEERLAGRASSEQLLPAMRRAFQAAGWNVDLLQAIGVVHGPGSFTGVRVGLSAAKGLCDALGVPLVAMSRLALLAASAATLGSFPEDVVAVLDAGRGEFYTGTYHADSTGTEALLRRPELLEQVAERTLVTCEPRVAELLSDLQELKLVAEPGAEAMLRMIREKMTAGDWADVETIDANYLRRTDAELLVESRNVDRGKSVG